MKTQQLLEQHSSKQLIGATQQQAAYWQKLIDNKPYCVKERITLIALLKYCYHCI